MGKRMGLQMRIAVVVVVAMLAAMPAGVVRADQVKLNVGLANPVLLADQKQTTYLKVGLTGFPMESMEKRTPVNVAIVLDKSGSMQGQKIQRAKEAAIMAIDRLRSDDIVSVVAYDSTVQVVLPATKVTDKRAIASAIYSIQADGSTALFGGVSKGAEEVRKFLDRNRVNRIVLLSDGLANVGPSSPDELGALGASLLKEGISVTTLGLGSGYNEDLLVKLSGESDGGNHYFVEGSADLVRIFDVEFGDILSVVAMEVALKIECAAGVRPVRAMGREMDISGNVAVAAISQLYSQQEKYVLLEIEVPPGSNGSARDVAKVSVSYFNVGTKTIDRLGSVVGVRFTDSQQVVERSTNPSVMVSVIEQIGNDNMKLALNLRDRGKVEDARQVLSRNSAYLSSNADKYNSKALQRQSIWSRWGIANLFGKNWDKQRKHAVGSCRSIATQQGVFTGGVEIDQDLDGAGRSTPANRDPKVKPGK